MPYTTLISATELLQHRDDPAFVILDCRGELTDTRAGALAFAAGHLPGAQHADPDVLLSDKSAGTDGSFRGRHPLPSPEAFIETLRHWGIHSHSQVVVYDGHGGMFAARVWWMLRWVGHSAATLLDGGLPAWLAAGQGMGARIAWSCPVAGDASASWGSSPVWRVMAAASCWRISRRWQITTERRPVVRFRRTISAISAVFPPPVGSTTRGAWRALSAVLALAIRSA